jgi:hypothetical protein
MTQWKCHPAKHSINCWEKILSNTSPDRFQSIPHNLLVLGCYILDLWANRFISSAIVARPFLSASCKTNTSQSSKNIGWSIILDLVVATQLTLITGTNKPWSVCTAMLMFTLWYLHEIYRLNASHPKQKNEPPILQIHLSTSYWRIKSSIQELLHSGTLQRASAAACKLHRNRFKTAIAFQALNETKNKVPSQTTKKKSQIHRPSLHYDKWVPETKPNQTRKKNLDNKVIYRYLLPTSGILKRIQLTPQPWTTINKECYMKKNLSRKQWGFFLTR